MRAIPELVTFAVSNLLRNACQHTEQGVISVCLNAAGIVVEDCGTGLPEAIRARLFDRFVRGDDDFTRSIPVEQAVAGSWLLLMLGALFENRPGMQRENSQVLPPTRDRET
ncbi:ATP-binding protein [Pseudomonas sp. ZB1P45]|uniref:ATP-binding protein n=1 Tax=Pseudomonas frigoris TaxID=3398356 RepID=UPI0039F0193B